jgi:hypothetical protein
MFNCDGCTLCCKFMGVDELHKPGNVWCQHCQIGEGCTIYETRPNSCRVYECVWLKTQALENPIPLELRPDKSRVVIGTANQGEDLILYVGPDRPDAWQSRGFGKFISDLQKRGVNFTVRCGEEVKNLQAQRQ